ncbi:MAG: endonuclease/exonuclease/phosphatase family protein [Chloroflexales bacterium]|nr:endonuclease/exonuclease/phosphatase family protein [Chloroflexales bacterium]
MPFTVCSANLRNANADDGADSWPHRHQLLASTLHTLHPDIIGVQECMDTQLDWLRDSFPGYTIMPGLPYGNHGPYEYAALALRTDLFTVTSHGNCFLSQTPHVQSRSWDCNWTRVANWVTVTHIPSGQTLCICNTHLDHLGALSRTESMHVIASQLAHLDHLPTIIMGDFNVAPTSAAHAALRSYGFVDSWQAAGHTDGAGVMTFHGFKGDEWPTRSGEPNDARIDWICTRDPHHQLNVVDAQICKNHDSTGRYPSDHYFVATTFQI